MKQFTERGLDKSGIKLIATGDVTDDDILNEMGDAALGVVNSLHYSAAHPSPANQKFVQAFEAANRFRPNFMAVAGYDGMRHFDAHPYRTEDADGVWDFARGCIHTYLILRDKARRFHEDPEIQAVLATAKVTELAVPTRPEGGIAALRTDRPDPVALAQPGLGLERLDQLVNELLLGVR